MRKVLPLVLGLAVLLAACGTKATPTIDAASVQASAVAMAFTMSAETQAAIPTATETPLPTETPTLPPPTPTLELAAFPTLEPTATKAGEGICYQRMMPNPPGRTFKLKIENSNGAPVNGNICLYQDRGHGVTGYIGVVLRRLGSTILNPPQGCYQAFFYVNDDKKPSQAWGTGLCANNGDKWTMRIEATRVIMLPP